MAIYDGHIQLACWTTWRRFLGHNLKQDDSAKRKQKNDSTTPSLRWKCKLGKSWTTEPRSRAWWQFVYDANEGVLYSDGAKWQKTGTRVLNGKVRRQFNREDYNGMPPECGQPVEVFETDSYALLLERRQQTGQATMPISRTIEQEVAEEEAPAIQDLLQHVTYLKDPYTIKELVEQQYQPVFAVSDGSKKDESMTFGWSVRVGTTDVIRCKGPAYGNATSHRAEGYGSLCQFSQLCLKLLFEFADISFETPINKYGCDNQGLLKRIGDRQESYDSIYPHSTTAPDWDVVEAIKTTRRISTIYPIWCS